MSLEGIYKFRGVLGFDESLKRNSKYDSAALCPVCYPKREEHCYFHTLFRFFMGIEVDGANSLINELDRIEEDWFSRHTVIVIADTDYAVYVEFGTYQMVGRPYIRPAIEFAESQADAVAARSDSSDEFVDEMGSITADYARSIVPVDTGYLRSQIRVLEDRPTQKPVSWADETLLGVGDAGPDDYDGPFDGANG